MAGGPRQARFRRPADFTELRVHGVGGTPPSALLDHDDPEQVAGDGIAGFYRRPDRDDLEAYSWGGTTAKSWSRALWILLLPFALCNVAGWMIVSDLEEQKRINTILKGIVRLFGMVVTALYVAWVGLLAIDVVGYQCGGQAACYDHHWWLRFFGNSFFDGDAARRIGVALAAPVGLVALFSYLTWKTKDRYEDRNTEEAGLVAGMRDSEVDHDPALSQGLADGPFWHSGGMVGTMARLHIAAALAAVAGLTSYALWRLDDDYGAGGSLQPVFLVAAIVIGVLCVAALLTLAWRRQWHSWALLALGTVSVAAVAAEAFFHNRDDVGAGVASGIAPQLLPGYSKFALGAVSILVALTLVIAAVLRLDPGRRAKAAAGKRRGATGGAVPATTQPLGFFGGYGPFFISVAAALSTGLLLAGTVVRLADWLGDRPGGDGDAACGEECIELVDPVLDYSNGYEWFGVILLAVVVIAIVDVARRYYSLKRGRFGWTKPSQTGPIDAEYELKGDSREPADCRNDEIEERCSGAERTKWLATIAAQRRIRSALGVADQAVGYFLAGSIAIAAVIFVARAFAGDLLDSPGPLWEEIRFLAAPGTWLAAALPFAAIWGIRRSIREEGARRKFGIVWDVVTFWPRWYHPLAPPSYSARAVPQLSLRLADLGVNTNGKVVVSAHSQGTVIAAATLLRVKDETLRNVALVTHGSPLRHLYGKFFPAYFGDEAMEKLHQRLTADDRTRWQNLYRLTDPIGGAIFGEKVDDSGPNQGREHGEPVNRDHDILVPDPLTDRHLPGDQCPEPEGHSNYFSDPQPCRCPHYQQAIARVRDRMP